MSHHARTRFRSLCLIGAAASLFACGCDAPVDGEFVGDARFALRGTAIGIDVTLNEPAASLVWLRERGFGEQTYTAGESVTLSTGIGGEFEVEVRREPPGDALFESGDAVVAVGTIVVFDDLNRDGRLDVSEEGGVAPDLVYAVPITHLLLYVAERGNSVGGLIANPELVEPGFQLVEQGAGCARIVAPDTALELVLSEGEQRLDVPVSFGSEFCDPR